MTKLHLAIATNSIAATVADYSRRLNSRPCLVISDQYALWRTPTLNLSVRQDDSCKPGELRHLGWEDAQAEHFTVETDVNGIVWERFSAQQQAEEINSLWPGCDYKPD
jgi:hypothetical protein